MAARYVRIGQYPDYRDEIRGKLSEILASTANPGTYAAPEDVAGCTLEMGADGKWTGASVGTLTQVQADALVASGAMATVKVGTPGNVAGVPYSWGGAGWGPVGATSPVQTPNVPATVYMVANDLNSGSDTVAASRQIATELFTDYMFDTGAVAKATQTIDGVDRFSIVPRFNGNNANNNVALDAYSKSLQFKSTAASVNVASTNVKSVKMSATPKKQKVASFIKTLIVPLGAVTFYGFRTPFVYTGFAFDTVNMYVVGAAPGAQVIKCSIVTSSGVPVVAATDVTLTTNGWITFDFPTNTSVLLVAGQKYYLQMWSSQYIGQYTGETRFIPNNTSFVYSGTDFKPQYTTDPNGGMWTAVIDSDIGRYTIQAAFYRNAKRFCLLIGDSVTDGYLANPAFPQALRTLALKEDADFSGGGVRDIVLLGTKAKRVAFSFAYSNTVNSTYSHEGRGGWTLYSYLRHSTQLDPNQTNWDLLGLGNGTHTDYTGSVAQRDLIATTAEVNATTTPPNPFFDNSLSGVKFSIAKWLSRYRTLDDAGTRLSVGSGTGSLIDAGNVATMDVCTPTDVFVMLGHNDFSGRRGTIDPFYADTRALIASIRADLPSANIYIGITLPLIGCDSKQFYPNYSALPSVDGTLWKQNSRYWASQSDFTDPGRVFALPMYWVTPTAEAFSVSSAVVGSATLKTPVPQGAAGWCHPNANAHDRYAGQIYSAMRYANYLDGLKNANNFWP